MGVKTILLPVIALLGGVGVGGASAYATGLILGPVHARPEAAEQLPTGFVPVSKILAPLVFADGRLAGYVSFDVQLEVNADKVDGTTQRLPLLLHAINMRTYRAPMAAGPDGMLPDLAMFRKIVIDASTEAFGPGLVRRVAITGAVPA